MPAILQDINDTSAPIPEFVIIDASLILELPSSTVSNPSRSYVTSFLNRLRNEALNGSVIPLLPHLALEECLFKICQRYFQSISNISSLSWHQYYKQNPSSIRNINPTLQQFYAHIQAFPMVIIEPEDLETPNPQKTISEGMLEYINDFELLPKDAAILSEADRMEVYTIATLDRDYLRADGFTVITTP